MNQKTKKITKVVQVMSNPHPEFVSLVGRGANQTPFKVVKTDEPMKTKDQTKVAKDPDTTPAANQADVEIHKMVFSGKQFADQAAVQKFMDDNGYENFTIDAVGSDFEIQAIPEDQFESFAPIKKAEGVTMFVGKLVPAAAAAVKSQKLDVTINIKETNHKPGEKDSKPAVIKGEGGEGDGEGEGDGDGAGEGSAQKAEDIRPRSRSGLLLAVKNDTLNKERKIDFYDAYFSNAATIAEVLKDAEDGIPVGFSDVHAAFMGALKTIVKADAVDQIPTLTNELGTILLKLANLTQGLEAKADRDEAVDKLFASVPSQGVTKKQSETPAPAATQPEDQTAIAKAMAPVLKLVEGIRESMATKADLTGITEKVAKQGAQLARVTALRQTKKSGDAEDVTPDGGEHGGQKPQKKEESPTQVTLRRNTFGL